jgi:hypothetical protein
VSQLQRQDRAVSSARLRFFSSYFSFSIAR